MQGRKKKKMTGWWKKLHTHSEGPCIIFAVIKYYYGHQIRGRKRERGV